MSKGYIYAFLSVIVMSFATILNSIFISDISNYTAVFINSCTVLCIILIQRITLKEKIIKKKFNVTIIFMSLFNLIGLLLMYESVRLLGASTYGFISRISIVFSLIIGIFILKEQSKISILGILLTIIGIIVMRYANIDGASAKGIIMTLGFAFSVSISNALAKKASEYTPNEKLLYNNILIFIIMFIYMLITKEYAIASYKIDTVLIFVISAFLNGFLGMKFYYLALKYKDFTSVTLIRTTSPIFTFIIADIILKLSIITKQKLLGGTLILIGVVLVLLKKRK
ncbi:MAG: EamA family transporter [Anaerorhabdus sp.]